MIGMSADLYRRRRAMSLGHISQVRMMMREGRFTLSCREIIKRAQRSLAYDRKSYYSQQARR